MRDGGSLNPTSNCETRPTSCKFVLHSGNGLNLNCDFHDFLKLIFEYLTKRSRTKMVIEIVPAKAARYKNRPA